MYTYFEEISEDSRLESSLFLSVLVVTVAFAEGLIFIEQPVVAVSIYLILVLSCAIAPFWAACDIRIFQSFAMISVFRVIDIGLPQVTGLSWNRIFITHLPVLIGLVLIFYYNERLEIRTNTTAWLAFPFILVLGACMSVIEFSVSRPPSVIIERDVLQIGLFILAFGVVVAVTEELLFRGLLQTSVSSALDTISGIFVSAVIFGVLHSAYGSLSGVVVATTFGFVYAIIYHLSEDIVVVIGLHAIINILLFGIFPLYRDSTIFTLL